MTVVTEKMFIALTPEQVGEEGDKIDLQISVLSFSSVLEPSKRLDSFEFSSSIMSNGRIIVCVCRQKKNRPNVIEEMGKTI